MRQTLGVGLAFNGDAQDLPNSIMQNRHLPVIQPLTLGAWTKPCLKEDFVAVDVANPREERLIHQGGFHGAASVAKLVLELGQFDLGPVGIRA